MWVISVLIVVFFACLGWTVIQPQYAVKIRIADGRAQVERGRVASKFLSHVNLVCHECGVARGWIGILRHGQRMSLRFSHDFAPGLQQRIRNEWSAGS